MPRAPGDVFPEWPFWSPLLRRKLAMWGEGEGGPSPAPCARGRTRGCPLEIGRGNPGKNADLAFGVRVDPELIAWCFRQRGGATWGRRAPPDCSGAPGGCGLAGGRHRPRAPHPAGCRRHWGDERRGHNGWGQAQSAAAAPRPRGPPRGGPRPAPSRQALMMTSALRNPHQMWALNMSQSL